MRLDKLLFTFFVTGFLLVPLQAYSYVGPGLGAGTLGVILGLLGSILLALFAFFWYPIKRALFAKKIDDEDDEDLAPAASVSGSEAAEDSKGP